MLEIVGEVSRRIGSWAKSLPEPETKPLFTPFYPSRMGDPFEGVFLSGALAASLERFRQQTEGGKKGVEPSPVDTRAQGVPTTAEMMGSVGIGQEGFISTKRLLWVAGMMLTWAGSGAVAYKAAEMWMGSDDMSAPVRITGSLVASFIATSVVNELFLRRLVHTCRTPSI